jgi:hypothetical protein
MKKLVNDVLGGEAPGVIDRRPALGVIGDDADEAVPHAAALVADGPRRDRLERDRVTLEAEPRLPTGQAAIRSGD